MQIQYDDDDRFTLDPPGSIIVIGAGPLGIESALYGRFLGYDVKIYESKTIGANLISEDNGLLPLLPDRTLSTLATKALKTHTESESLAFPVTISEWVDNHLTLLTQTDLLAERVLVGCHVTQIDLEPVELEDDDIEDDIPADFKLTYTTESGESHTDLAESVIIATGGETGIKLNMPTETPYLFRIGGQQVGKWEQNLSQGLQEIVRAYASLGGRPDLDLYRPCRT